MDIKYNNFSSAICVSLRSIAKHLSHLLLVLSLILSQSFAGLTDAAQKTSKDLIAAQSGDANSQFKVGAYYEFGIGVPKDYSKAMSWYKKAADHGHAAAKASLGYLYQTGHGQKINAKRASEFYKSSAELGNIRGQFLLGVAYINGIGVRQDPKKAALWIHKAAAAGHQQSQLMLATMLHHGLGVKRNEFAARRWFGKAAKGKNSKIAEKAKTIKKQIDDKVLFSGSFRNTDLAALIAVGFGIAFLMAAVSSTGAKSNNGQYNHQQYKQKDSMCWYYRYRPLTAGEFAAASSLNC